MRIRVDPDLCEGYGQCARHLPEVFDLDDPPVQLRAPFADGGGDLERLREELERAVARCPRTALSLVED